MERWVKSREGTLFEISRSKVWSLFQSVDEDLYPHWFRAQRACQLAVEYGWDASDLSEFFEWKHWPTALRYASKGYKKLAEMMEE